MFYFVSLWNRCVGLKKACELFRKDICVRRECMVMHLLMSMT